jgi:hypothetical protein
MSLGFRGAGSMIMKSQTKPMNFSDLNFHPHTNYPGGISAKHFFPNGYGVSVVRFTTPYGYLGGSYGAEQGLYEVAVLKGVEGNWEICYHTHITEDVLGHLTEEEVEDVLQQIEDLTV